MNLFLFWTNEAGERELVTPPLDGTILPGVTRDSILTLTKEWKEFKVSERPVSMKEAAKAIKEGRMIEMFGAGTRTRDLTLRHGCDRITHQDNSIPR